MKKRVTKTESLRLRIFRDILRGTYSPGDPLPPEREMALLAKVSRIIVRQAYAELEAAGIVQREQGRGTFVARTAGGSAHNKDTIALLTSIRDAFSLEFLAAVEQAVAQADAMLVIKLTEEDPAREEAAAIELVAKGVRNLIVWPSGRGLAEETFRRLRVLGTNLVFFDRILPGDYADYIGLDNARAVGAILQHAVERGGRHFVFINLPSEIADTARMRQEAFEAWCKRHGVEHEVVAVPWRGDYAAAIADRLAAWSDQGRQTALVCLNDDIACSIKSTVDDRLPVYGINGLEKARLAGVTSYRQPMERMAAEAVTMIRNQQKGKWTAVRTFCCGELAIP